MNYLIASTSFRLIEEEIEKIIPENSNVTRYDLTFDELENILEEAAYVSLFDDEKYIIIKNADMFTTSKTKFNEEYLIKYLEEPNEKTTLIFVTGNKVDERKKLTTIIKSKYKYINIKNPTIKEIYTKLENIFKKDKYKIDSKSIYYIINNSLNNYDLAYKNVEKIKLFYLDEKDVKYEDIVKITSVNAEENNFKFVDSVIGKDIKNTMKLLEDLLLNKNDPLMLINLLIREYKLMYQVKELSAQTSKMDIMKKLKLQDWQLEKILKNNYEYKKEELYNNLEKLLEMDYDIKRSRIDKKLALELFILSL